MSSIAGVAPTAAASDGAQSQLRDAVGAFDLTPTSVQSGSQRKLVNPACVSYEYEDRARETRSRIDVVAYSLDYDCTSKQWELRITTTAGFRVDQIGYLAIALDTDLQPRNNCGGVDVQVVAFWDAEIQRLLTGVIQFQGSCRTGRVGSIHEFQHANGSKSLSLRFGSSWFGTRTPEQFNWFAFVSSNPDATGSWWDGLPNRGYHEARASDLGAIERLSMRTPASRSEFSSIAAGDFFGDGTADILGYRRVGADSFIRTRAVGSLADVAITGLSVARSVVAGDFDGNGYDDLLFYEPGSGVDSIRWHSNASPVTTTITLDGSYRLAAGDFDGDLIDDVVLHRPGVASDRVWFGRGDRAFDVVTVAIDDDGVPLVGDFDGDLDDDLLFWKSDRRSTTLMRGQNDRTFLTSAGSMGGAYRFAAAGDFNGDRRDDVVFTDGGMGRDALWNGKASSPWFGSGGSIVLNERLTQIAAADLTGDGGDDLWIDLPGSNLGYVWSSRQYSVPKLAPIPTVNVGIGEPITMSLPDPGGYAPYTWGISGTFGTMLEGLLIDPVTGVIAGKSNGPPGRYRFTVEVRDRYERMSSQSFFVEVADLPATELPFSGFGAMITDRVQGHVIITGGAGNDDLVVVDDEGAIVRHVEGLAGANVVAFGDDVLYVSLHGSHAVVALDRETFALVGAYDVGIGREPTSLAVAAGRLWFGYSAMQAFGSVDLTTAEVMTYEIAFEVVPALFKAAVYADERTPAGNIYVYGTESFCNLALFDVSGANPVVTATPPFDVFDAHFCGELVRQASGPTIVTTGTSVETFDATMQTRTTNPFPARTVDYAPVNGGWVVLTNRVQLLMYRPGGTLLRYVARPGGEVRDAVLSPSGTRALAVSVRFGEPSRVLIAATPN